MTAAAARLSGLRRDLPARAQVVRAFGVLAIGGVLALCGWIPFDLQPHPGLDQSWVGALHMAAHSDLAWGRDLVFTYGPLGFLRLPAYWYGDTGALAIAYWLVVRVTAFAALWLLARRAFGGVGAFVLLLLIVHELSEPLLPVAFAWGAWLLHRRPGPRAHTAFAVVVGAVGALELLAKVNNGVTILALGAVALLFVRADRWRWLLVFAGSALFALLAGWLVTGQPLSALPDYLLNSARVTSGYSAAMNTDGDRWQITAALVVFLLGAYGIWRIGEPGRARRGMLALWLLLAFTQYKAAFVRHDAPHVIQYFAVLLPALVALPWPRAMRPYALATSAAALLVLVGLRGEPVTEFTQPWHRVSAARHDLGSLNDRAAKRAAGVAEVRNDAGLTPATLAALNGRTVHVAPYEASVVWAYNLRWKPMPVFQSYQAYTRGLDEVNARALEKPSGPERILLGAQPPVDGRVPGWESPAAVTAML
ncbi:MAG: hypothetical protein QOE08_759, partial [Thermoleophilaceae bacterium]|nr:hypothetical protein [Thermoleophilaceae bacterium]